MRINPILVMLVLCGISLPALPDVGNDVRIRAAEITSYGVLNADYTKRKATGYTDRATEAHYVDEDSVRFVEFTDKIPGELGIQFGYQYVINTAPKGGRMLVTEVITFPEGGLQRPRGRLYTESRDTYEITIGEPTVFGYAFDYEWEIVPGEWVFEVYYKNAPIVRKRFFVEVSETAGVDESVGE